MLTEASVCFFYTCGNLKLLKGISDDPWALHPKSSLRSQPSTSRSPTAHKGLCPPADTGFQGLPFHHIVAPFMILGSP